MPSFYLVTFDVVAVDFIELPAQMFYNDINKLAPFVRALSEAFGGDAAPFQFYYPYQLDESAENYEWWFARSSFGVSVGKKKAVSLSLLCQAIAQLITNELPDYRVQMECVEFQQ